MSQGANLTLPKNTDHLTPNDDEGSHLTEYLILLLVLAGGVICTLIAPNLRNAYWREVLSKFADALVIAALVGLFVEVRLVKAAVKRMEVFQARTVDEIRAMMIYGLRKHLSKKRIDTLEQQVLYPSFLREEFDVLITLTHEPQGNIKGTVSLRYYIRNISTQDQTYMVHVYLDEVFGDNSAQLASVAINSNPIDLANPRPGRIHREAGTLRFEYPIVIPGGDRVHVQALGHQLMADADVWPWHLAGVSDSLHITVTYPQDLFLLLAPIHPVSVNLPAFGLADSSGTAQTTASEDLLPYRTTQAAINDILLPFQGFEVRWKPKLELLPNQTETASA